MVVSTANPARTVADVVAQARAKPAELTYGSSGVGSSLHMSGVILEQRTGVKLQHVPYRGARRPRSSPSSMARSRRASSMHRRW
jgi:tripartite-type tricarboxylate transporter receptor subunit TctC